MKAKKEDEEDDRGRKRKLEQIIEAGLYAASGMGQQAVITIAVTDKTLRDKMPDAAPRKANRVFWKE